MTLQRLLHSIFVLWISLTLVFVALRVLPGDALSGTQFDRSQAEIEAQREQLGLNDSLLVQYGRYLLDLLQAELGTSLVTREKVSVMIGVRLVPTLSLGLAAFGIATLIGSVLGIISSWNTPLRPVSDAIIVMAQALPIYVTALLLIYLFSLELDWLPASGSSSPLHLILPATTLGFHTAGSIAHVLNASLRDAYDQPYLLTARAKGLPLIDQFDHAFRIAILPALSVLALQAGFLLGGTVIVEVIFVRRGIGSLLFQAVLDRDYPVVQALTLLSALVYMIANALSNLGHRLLDPRLSYA